MKLPSVLLQSPYMQELESSHSLMSVQLPPESSGQHRNHYNCTLNKYPRPPPTQPEALVTVAFEHAHLVVADAVDTHVLEQTALVYIHAVLVHIIYYDVPSGVQRHLLGGGGVHEPEVALAAEGAWVVEAVPVRTEGRVLRTLVNILALVAVTCNQR